MRFGCCVAQIESTLAANHVEVNCSARGGIGAGTRDRRGTGTVWTAPQVLTDELKADFVPLTEREAFSALDGLTPVTFSYRYDPTGNMQVGFMAADVPDLLSVPGRQMVAPLQIIAALTKVVQSQQAAIAALEESLRSLEPR